MRDRREEPAFPDFPPHESSFHGLERAWNTLGCQRPPGLQWAPIPGMPYRPFPLHTVSSALLILFLSQFLVQFLGVMHRLIICKT